MNTGSGCRMLRSRGWLGAERDFGFAAPTPLSPPGSDQHPASAAKLVQRRNRVVNAMS
ncbi:hypothetical protein LY76DRAFT_596599 [Colletotrichum caudatum]|nr:hypothetical protein LY76DRAFT_596599 [Colletotrichum caudatum]